MDGCRGMGRDEEFNEFKGKWELMNNAKFIVTGTGEQMHTLETWENIVGQGGHGGWGEVINSIYKNGTGTRVTLE